MDIEYIQLPFLGHKIVHVRLPHQRHSHNGYVLDARITVPDSKRTGNKKLLADKFHCVVSGLGCDSLSAQ